MALNKVPDALITLSTADNQVIFSSGNAVTGNTNFTWNNTSSVLTVTGNANVGNLAATGTITATGNVTGNYLLGNGALLTGVITSVANINFGTSNVTVTSSGGNITAGVGGTANVLVLSTAGANVTGTANITGGISTAGAITATGNVTGSYIFGNGALLTGVITSVANINLGTSNVTVTSSGGNVSVGIGGTNNVAVFATTGEYITGVLSVTGNANVGNIGAAAGVFTGNVTASTFIDSANSNYSLQPHLGSTLWDLYIDDWVVIQGGTDKLNPKQLWFYGRDNSFNGSFVAWNDNSIGSSTSSDIFAITANGQLPNRAFVIDQSNRVGINTTAPSQNFDVNGNARVSANAIFGNINSVSGILSVTGNANVGNIGATGASITGNAYLRRVGNIGGVAFTLPSVDGSAGQVLITDGAGVLSWTNNGAGAIPTQLANGTSNVVAAASGNVTTSGDSCGLSCGPRPWWCSPLSSSCP